MAGGEKVPPVMTQSYAEAHLEMLACKSSLEEARSSREAREQELQEEIVFWRAQVPFYFGLGSGLQETTDS